MNQETVVATSRTFLSEKSFYYAFKRLFDILVGIVGILVMIPLAIVIKIISIANKDFKSIFFKQERIGKDGKIFTLYKFRTMVQDADDILYSLIHSDEDLKKEYTLTKKLKKDPRVTKIGKFLRKTSLDEIPQLINILKGDMTLIGNRPYLPREKDDMAGYYHDILKTKPGLTGYWQVSGRSDTTFNRRLELESYYSEHANLKMDIKIFFKTFAVVFKCTGAK